MSESENLGYVVGGSFLILLLIASFWLHSVLVNTGYHMHAPIVWSIPFIYLFVAGAYKLNKIRKSR